MVPPGAGAQQAGQGWEMWLLAGCHNIMYYCTLILKGGVELVIARSLVVGWALGEAVGLSWVPKVPFCMAAVAWKGEEGVIFFNYFSDW